MAHTPGPWRVEKEPYIHVRSEAGCVLASDYTTSENAALIAAAPELLKALKEARSMLEIVGLDDADDDYRASWAKGRATIDAAIFKAETP